MYFLYVILKLLELIRKIEILKGAFTYESGTQGLSNNKSNPEKHAPRSSKQPTHSAKQGYEQLSIKNICEEAGVSNGSFITILRRKMIFFLII